LYKLSPARQLLELVSLAVPLAWLHMPYCLCILLYFYEQINDDDHDDDHDDDDDDVLNVETQNNDALDVRHLTDTSRYIDGIAGVLLHLLQYHPEVTLVS